MPSVSVFIDYENVHRVGHSIFASRKQELRSTLIDPLRLAHRLVQAKGDSFWLDSVYVFRGRPVPTRQPRAAAENDSLANDWSRDKRVHVIRRDLQYFPTSDGFTAREKGIDVAFAVTVTEVALSGRCDNIVAVSTDTDLVPALELVFHRTDVHLEIATWDGARPLWFKEFLKERPPRRLPYSHRLSREDFDSVRQR